MRKLFFAAVMIFAATSAMAQITFESSSLKDALAKAKAENKLVMAIGSATWCGPCQNMAKNVYPLPEVGKFFNERFVSLKYELDKADPDKIIETYGLKAYPTYFFLNGDGVEVARMVGGARDPQGFIERVTNVTAKENQWPAREERFKKDPSYAVEYIQALDEAGRSKEAAATLAEVFAKRTVKENFSKESLELYKSQIKSVDSPILKYMVDNKKDVEKIMGKKQYVAYCQELISTIIFGGGSFSKEPVMDAQIAFVKANPMLKSGMATVLMNAKSAILAKDGVEVITEANANFKDLTETERDMLIWYGQRNTKKTDSNEELIKFVNQAIGVTKDAEKVENYKSILQRLTALPAGAIPAARMS